MCLQMMGEINSAKVRGQNKNLLDKGGVQGFPGKQITLSMEPRRGGEARSQDLENTT